MMLLRNFALYLLYMSTKESAFASRTPPQLLQQLLLLLLLAASLPAVQQSIDVSCSPGAQQQTRRDAGRMGLARDSSNLLRPRCAQCQQSVNSLVENRLE